ncbi:MAG: sulfatase-like hydrolase/transferase, partial [Actinobacteria bacterium]|nr:sulfatase-like hydrolase/transferase [Actinomycetota bacterium]
IHVPAWRLPKLAGGLAAIDGGGTRPLLWSQHLILPHVPWTHVANGDKYDDSSAPFPGMVLWGWAGSEYENQIALNQQRMIAQAQFADKIVGGLRRRLEAEGIWDKALVIVTADHGGAYTPGVQRRAIDTINFAEIASVPLLVKYPRQRRGRVSLRDTNSTQILPTVAKLTGSAAEYQGTSLLDAPPVKTLTVRTSDNDPSTVSLGISEMLSQQRAEIRQRDRRFPQTNIFRRSDNRQTIGKRVSTLAIRSGTSAGSLTLDNPEYFADLKPGSGWLPAAYLTARASGLPTGVKIAVAVNGRVVGNGQTFSAPQSPFEPADPNPEVRLAAMLDPAWLRPGRAEVSFYREGGSSLQRVRLAP